MVRLKFDYSYRPDLAGSLDFNMLPAWRRGWLDTMNLEEKLPEASQQLRAEREYLVKKLEELDKLIDCLEARTARKSKVDQTTVVLHPEEFASMGIATAAEKMIRRANCPLHVRDITEGLKAGGYRFKTKNPLASVISVLFQERRNKGSALRFKGKNIYSLVEIEEKRWAHKHNRHPVVPPPPPPALQSGTPDAETT
ncbi:MAG: hypothetical protein HY237_02000 [Acidobacteria bacterium]|nr:hypothetical protein [Acidobacteriota bacterium]